MDAEASVAETISDADDFAADISSIDTSAALSTSSREKNVEAGASTEDDEVSMDELEAAEASFDNTPVASASKPVSAEEAVEEHATIGVVTSAEKVVETTPMAITSCGGTIQGGPSGSGSHMDPSLLDSSPSIHQYVRRARRGSLVSTDSERTVLATVRVSIPPSPLPESGGTTPTPITTAAEASTAATVPESKVVPTAIEEIPVGEKGPAHVPDIPKGNNFV